MAENYLGGGEPVDTSGLAREERSPFIEGEDLELLKHAMKSAGEDADVLQLVYKLFGDRLVENNRDDELILPSLFDQED